MSGFEMLVAGVALLVGYGAVSLLMSRSGRQAAPASEPVLPWNRVLGVEESATAEEIQAAYNLLVGQYHPDKVASLGPELRALAERRTREIAAAYSAGMRLRGDSPSS